MNEFLREVDEEYRRDRVLAFWSRYGLAIALIVAVALGGFAGWRYLDYKKQQDQQGQTARFYDIILLLQKGQAEDALKILEGFTGNTTGPLRGLVTMRRAGETIKHNSEEAAKLFDEAAQDMLLPLTVRDLARMRAAMLRLEGEKANDALAVLETFTGSTHPWRHQAREGLGAQALKAGKSEAAARWFDAILADPQTPSSLRSRMEIYSALR
jgi:hypothetical protein